MTTLDVSSNARGLVVTKLHVKLPRAEGLKICSYSQDHMTNMATKPIYGNFFLKIMNSRTN